MNALGRYLVGLAVPVLLVVAVASGPVHAADTTDISVGDTVVVLTTAELGVREQVAVVLAAGDKIHVTEVRGEWIGGYAFVKGKRSTGWVNTKEVKKVPAAVVETPVIEVPDKADDAAAVEKLKAAEAKLELNPRGAVQIISAAESKFTDDEAAGLRGLHQLATVELSGRPIGDATLEALAGAATLQELYVDGSKITDAGMKHIQKLKNLEVLALNNTKITSAGLASLEGLSQLRVLNLSNCEITNDGLKHLSKLTNLDTLALPGTKVTGEGLVHLKPLARLRVLNLIGDEIDDAGLDHLMDLTELRMLYLKKTKVTDAGTRKLDDAVAGLAIYR